MSTGFERTATHELTRVALTLAPQSKRGRWLVLVAALVAAAFAAGGAVGELVRDKEASVVARVPASPNAESTQLRQQLEQATMALRVAEARGEELERQIDALNHKLAESQDELTFFRKAREGRRH